MHAGRVRKVQHDLEEAEKRADVAETLANKMRAESWDRDQGGNAWLTSLLTLAIRSDSSAFVWFVLQAQEGKME